MSKQKTLFDSKALETYEKEEENFWRDDKYKNYRNRLGELSTLPILPYTGDHFSDVITMDYQHEESSNLESIRENIVKGNTRNSKLGNLYGSNSVFGIVRGSRDNHIVEINGRKVNLRVSSFPSNVTKHFVYFYTDKNETVFDPFMGHNSRMEAVITSYRNYIAYDVCEEYVKMTQERYNQLKTAGFKNTAVLHFDTSENVQEADNSVDFVFTSPPFYKQEFYDDDPRQLGLSSNSYDEFLDKMQVIINQCYRVLKPNRHIAFNVENFKVNGELITFDIDIVNAFRKAGFIITDMVIMPYTAITRIFKSERILEQSFAKAHSTTVVAKKVVK